MAALTRPSTPSPTRSFTMSASGTTMTVRSKCGRSPAIRILTSARCTITATIPHFCTSCRPRSHSEAVRLPSHSTLGGHRTCAARRSLSFPSSRLGLMDTASISTATWRSPPRTILGPKPSKWGLWEIFFPTLQHRSTSSGESVTA